MNRRRFFFGTIALLATGCGGGGAPTSKYRYVGLGDLFPLGLDDLGRAYLIRPEAQTKIHVANVDSGATITIPADASTVHKVRPDGTLVTRRGFVPLGGTHQTVPLPTLFEFEFPGEASGDWAVEVADAKPNGDYLGLARMNNSLGRHIHSFVVRSGVRTTLASANLEPSRLLDTGHVLLNGSRSDLPARLFGPDNQHAAHPINASENGFVVREINEALQFTGYNATDNHALVGILRGDSNGVQNLGRSGKSLLNTSGDLLWDGFTELSLSGGPDANKRLQLDLAGGSSVTLLPFLPNPESDFALVGFNKRREILGYRIEGEAFLLLPE
jgi:hypothetical protein